MFFCNVINAYQLKNKTNISIPHFVNLINSGEFETLSVLLKTVDLKAFVERKFTIFICHIKAGHLYSLNEYSKSLQ